MRYAEQRRTVERCDAPYGAATSHMGGRSCAERRPATWGNSGYTEQRPAIWGQRLCVAATSHVRAAAAAMRSGGQPCEGNSSFAERRSATTTTTTIITIIILARFRDLA